MILLFITCRFWGLENSFLFRFFFFIFIIRSFFMVLFFLFDLCDFEFGGRLVFFCFILRVFGILELLKWLIFLLVFMVLNLNGDFLM